ncbi:TPX2 family protein [Abortiporus biennis]
MPLSPMRTSVKRSSSPAPSEQRQRKKTKGPSGDSKPGNELSHVARDPIGPKGKALQPSRVKNTSGHSTFTSKSSQRGLAKSRSKSFKSSDNNELKSSEVQHKRSRSRTDTAASSANAELNGGNQLISSGSSIVNGTSEEFTFSSAAGRSGDQHRDHGYLVPDRGFRGLKDSNTSSSNAAGNSRPSGRTQHNERSTSTLPPAKPTRPIEFNFHLDARIEARKAELALGSSSTSNSKSTHTRVHSAQEQEQILAIKRKEHITPVVPIGFNFSTDIRAVEREKFELARREREREAERLIEEKKRLQELEDEREIKELRKRAVPKANEIPEWYAFAPKRSHKAS